MENVLPEWRQRPLDFNDLEVDHYSVVVVEDGVRKRFEKPVKASDDEIREREIASLHRALEGIGHRLAHVEEPLAWYEDAPSAAEIERRKAGLQAERSYVLSKLEELGAIEPAAEPKRGLRK